MASSIFGCRAVRQLLVVAAAVVPLTVLPTVAATAAPSQNGCDNRTNNTYSKLLECVRLEGVRAHQAALQAIADDNGGTRAAGTPGYTDSVEYVVDTLENAGWNVTLDEFPFTFIPPPTLSQLTPVAATYETGAFTGTGFGTVTGNVLPVDINLVPPRASTSGCEAADFAGLNFSGPSDIALIQRGTCTFAVKAVNAQAAGAEALIIFNQGNTPDREGLIIGTLIPGGEGVTIPVVGASFADGAALAQAGSTALVDVDPPESRPQVNVIAELPGANNNNVVMAGAHLDSVQAGPGINDNGSGSSTILEIAEQMTKVKPRNKVRFIWFSAEESGLFGSTAYVASLSQAERSQIAAMLNFDIVASPNFARFVFDGDLSHSPPPPSGAPEGSAAIEELFLQYFAGQGLVTEPTEFDGRSDYGPFIEAGIPAGGLFTGAEGIKTAAQVAVYGGVAGEQYDECYHLSCDDIDNLNLVALDQMSDAAAHATISLAQSTQAVNGQRGKGNFNIEGGGAPAPIESLSAA
jgi:Zn-dependent M28 family amino/carboxypeptidase